MDTVTHAAVDNRNQGIPLDLGWIERLRADADAIEETAAALAASARATREPQSLLLAISLMDLTTLADDDTDDRVRRLCRRGRHPLPPELTQRLGSEAANLHVAAVCVYPPFIHTALDELQGTGIRVATVSADFPQGLAPLDERILQIHRAVEAGAHEIDVVIKRAHVLEGNWQALYDEVAAFKAACAPRIMKVILGTGELRSLGNIARASLVVIMAGADFIKTSTGKEAVNATVPAALAMTRAIGDYAHKTGLQVGFKPAGGIRTAKQALEYLTLVRQELGEPWLRPSLFRIGASSVLDDIEGELQELVG